MAGKTEMKSLGLPPESLNERNMTPKFMLQVLITHDGFCGDTNLRCGDCPVHCNTLISASGFPINILTTAKQLLAEIEQAEEKLKYLAGL